MPDTKLPALEFDDVIRLKQRAARHGRPVESEVCAILQEALSNDRQPGFDELAAELRALTAGRQHTPAEELMHECRVER
jgi:plasmid stability protein